MAHKTLNARIETFRRMHLNEEAINMSDNKRALRSVTITFAEVVEHNYQWTDKKFLDFVDELIFTVDSAREHIKMYEFTAPEILFKHLIEKYTVTFDDTDAKPKSDTLLGIRLLLNLLKPLSKRLTSDDQGMDKRIGYKRFESDFKAMIDLLELAKKEVIAEQIFQTV